MSVAGCSYQTDRLDVAEWHDAVRSANAGSLVEIVAVLLTPAVTRSLPAGWQGSYDVERAAGWIAERDTEGTTLLAVERATASAVGLVLLHQAPAGDDDHVIVRLGYLLAESAWGRGLGREMVAGLVRWNRGSPDVEALVAGVSAANLASVRILESCGFTRARVSEEDGDDLEYRLHLS